MPTPDAAYVGIDLGTSGCRGIAIDAAGTVLAEHRVGLPAPRRAGAQSDQDPALWWAAVEAVLGGLAAAIGPRVVAVAVDGTSGSLLLTDATGQPLGPALMYNDARATAEAARIAAHGPLESGAHGASASLAKLLWLLARPEARRAAHALHQADWVAGRLCGRWGLSDENNALKLGYDPVTRRWPQWLDALQLPRGLLPQVCPPGTVLGTIDAALARRLGLPAHTRIVAGTTDSIAAFLATGARAPGDAVTSLGSTLALKVLSPRPVFGPESGVYSHRLWDRWLAGGASNTGGAVLAQFFDAATLARLSRQIDPTRPSGLDYYPLPVAGERFPVADPALPPRLAPRPPDDARFLHGLLEGIARIEAEGYRRLAALGAPYPARVFSVGGGAANPVWSQIRARALGVPLAEPAHHEAAYGAALLACRAIIDAHTQGGRDAQ